MRNATWRTLGFVVGQTAGNILAVAAPRIQITTKQTGDENGIATFNITAKCRRIVGDDELFILHR